MAGEREALLSALGAEIADERVLAAMAAVPREAFVPEAVRDRAWEDAALPIGGGQSISQPFVVARMAELLALRGDETVLDVGTGSGYAAAVLARLARRVVSIERRAELSAKAAAVLGDSVELVVGDGTEGWPEAAPFDAIHVAAAARATPRALLEQLAEGGRLVLPLRRRQERLVRIVRRGEEFAWEAFEPVRFVPLV